MSSNDPDPKKSGEQKDGEKVVENKDEKPVPPPVPSEAASTKSLFERLSARFWPTPAQSPPPEPEKDKPSDNNKPIEEPPIALAANDPTITTDNSPPISDSDDSDVYYDDSSESVIEGEGPLGDQDKNISSYSPSHRQSSKKKRKRGKKKKGHHHDPSHKSGVPSAHFELETTFKSKDYLLKDDESTYENPLPEKGSVQRKTVRSRLKRKIRLKHKKHLKHFFCCGCERKPFSHEKKESLEKIASAPIPDFNIPIEEVAAHSDFMTRKVRRTRIPNKPNISFNVLSVLKNAIGKELSKIPFPVNFSEPLSMLQRLVEEFEYSNILDRAVNLDNSVEQLAYVSAFTVSAYAITSGETYECDRTADDFGWRCISEQVSHHPPIAAYHCDSTKNGWVCWQQFSMNSKFKGNSLEIHPTGITHLLFKESQNHYTWKKVVSTVRSIIFGKMYIEHTGEMTIQNHTTGDSCKLIFGSKRQVNGKVIDNQGKVHFTLKGNWDSTIESTNEGSSSKTVLWARKMPNPESVDYYNMTEFACQLNELEEDIAPTDSRLRPDQRLMEEGRWDEANEMKLILERNQRARRRLREINVMGRPESQTSVAILHEDGYQPPSWFVKAPDPQGGGQMFTFNGDYWKCKENKNWTKCPLIYFAPASSIDQKTLEKDQKDDQKDDQNDQTKDIIDKDKPEEK